MPSSAVMRSDFGEVLLKFCLRGLSGCFIVESQGKRGIIYLINGLVVHSIVDDLSGLPAFLQFFTWECPDRFEWTLNMAAKEQTMALSYEAVIVMGSYAENVTNANPTSRDLLDEENYFAKELILEIAYEADTLFYTIKDKQVRVGRSIGNDLVLDHRSVSRQHAFLTLFQDGLIVHDLGSSNGTFVNGEAISLCTAKEGDEIDFGQLNCKLVAPPSPPGSEKPSKRTPGDEVKTTRINISPAPRTLNPQ